MKAIEFFSGIGAFSEAARNFEIEVVAAFDQNVEANETFAHNFALKPSDRTLDSLKADYLPTAEIWWLSPPCTPYTVRGHRKDLADNRAKSLLNLIQLMVKLQPETIMIENVLAFKSSQANQHLRDSLTRNGYRFVSFDLCSSDFGVPMKRPRHFIVATLNSSLINRFKPFSRSTTESIGLNSFLHADGAELLVPPDIMSRYGDGFDLVERQTNQLLSCFTKNYAKCMKASGSLLNTELGPRRFSPEEILRLLGFSEAYNFPNSISTQARWRLVGNSVDVRAIGHLFHCVTGTCVEHLTGSNPVV